MNLYCYKDYCLNVSSGTGTQSHFIVMLIGPRNLPHHSLVQKDLCETGHFRVRHYCAQVTGYMVWPKYSLFGQSIYFSGQNTTFGLFKR